MAQRPVVSRDTIGTTSIVGLVSGAFAIFSAFWIPTLALLFSVGTIVAGAIDHRGSSGPRRAVAALMIALGIGTILATAAVLVLTSGGPTSGTAGDVVPPPPS